MKVAVWDTYVTRNDGQVMHFDIIVPAELSDAKIVYRFGMEYLKSKNQDSQPLTANECSFCHIEIVKPEWKQAIEKNNYYIYEMENCG